MIRKKQNKGLIDMSGKRFGCIRVLRRAELERGKWVCQCDCGRLIARTRTAIINKKYKQECSCDRDKRRGHVNLEFPTGRKET